MNQAGNSSRVFNEAVLEFSKLPGIGEKTAIRMVLHLLKQNKEDILNFSSALNRLATEIKRCKICHNISDTDICPICENKNRDERVICVVENIKDLVAIEKTSQFNGKYHVLGGTISPMDGIGPSDLNIESLELRVNNGNVNELILALNPSMEGDTTNFYIYKKLNKYNIKMSTIARGIAFGNELEYIDEITLGRSIINRKEFDGKSI